MTTKTIKADSFEALAQKAYHFGLAYDADTDQTIGCDAFAGILADIAERDIMAGASFWFAIPERLLGNYTGKLYAAMFSFDKGSNALHINGEALVDQAVEDEIHGQVDGWAYRIVRGEKVYI